MMIGGITTSSCMTTWRTDMRCGGVGSVVHGSSSLTACKLAWRNHEAHPAMYHTSAASCLIHQLRQDEPAQLAAAYLLGWRSGMFSGFRLWWMMRKDCRHEAA